MIIHKSLNYYFFFLRQKYLNFLLLRTALLKILKLIYRYLNIRSHKKIQMFKSKSKNDAALPPSSVSIIGAGNIFSGDLECNGDLRIDGTVKGSIYSKAKVIIGQTGFIEGDIHCNEADITGSVTGNIFTKAALVLKENAVVNGDVHTVKLIIEPTASFNGKCVMGENNLQAKVDNNNTNFIEHAEKHFLLAGHAAV